MAVAPLPKFWSTVLNTAVSPVKFCPQVQPLPLLSTLLQQDPPSVLASTPCPSTQLYFYHQSLSASQEHIISMTTPVLTTSITGARGTQCLKPASPTILPQRIHRTEHTWQRLGHAPLDWRQLSYTCQEGSPPLVSKPSRQMKTFSEVEVQQQRYRMLLCSFCSNRDKEMAALAPDTVTGVFSSAQ